MKATDLMIGDWYYWESEGKMYPYQVTAEDFVKGEIPNVQPIPLTEEILEKNGFGRIDGKGTNFLIKGFLYWSSFAKRIFVQGHPNQIDWIDVCECQYIHELQHAFKLCGIKKEIVL